MKSGSLIPGATSAADAVRPSAHPADAFTRAPPQFISAQATNNADGVGFREFRPRRGSVPMLLAQLAGLAAFIFIIAMVLGAIGQ